MQRITEGRALRNWTQEELAQRMGTSQAYISKLEKAKNLRVDTCERVANALGVTLSWLLGLSDDPYEVPLEGPVHMKPVMGNIAAGTPREAIEQGDQMHPVPAYLYDAHKHGFWLRVSGNSMNRLFPDGALVYVDLNAEVRNGDVGVVFVNGDDATVKRVYFEGNAIRLRPDSFDPEYQDRVIFANDPDAPEVSILGKVVSYTAPENWRP